ncbi:MAG: hypothetical protein WCH34_00015 [Bacteroidota bacterium]
MKNTKLINTIHWTAIIIGTLMVAFVLLFAIGYAIDGSNKAGPGLDNHTIFAFTIWGIGLAGLVLAIWKPGIGGLISFLSFILFNILPAISSNPEARYHPILLIFLLPSILYLLYWWLKKSGIKNS